MTTHTVYSPDAFEMACSFVRWYYPLINGCCTGSSHCDLTENFGSQHFWLDASAQVTLQSGTSKENSAVQDNGKMSSELLRKIVQEHSVTFNPNISKEGVHGVIDAHGLAIVVACGTLHSSKFKWYSNV